MLRTLVVLSGLVTAAAIAPSAVKAGTASPLSTQVPARATAIEQVQFWDIGRCRAWRRECADRWGWRSARWHRCLARHGCERYRYGDRWD
jgi:hypothetical protein